MNEPRESDIRKVIRQEELLVFRTFDLADAWSLGSAMRLEAEKYNTGVVVDIRHENEILFFTAMPGTTPENEDWARRKRNVVSLMKTSSYLVGLEVRFSDSISKVEQLNEVDYAWHGGCFPIRLTTGEIVATATVSGLPQRDDHKLVTDVIADFLGVDLGNDAL